MSERRDDDTPAAPRRFRPYPAYKPSGVEWLGEIPEGWDTKRLKYLCSINPTKTEIKGIDLDTEVSFIPMESVEEGGGLILESIKKVSEVWAGYTYFRDGDILLAKITPCFENGKGGLCSGLYNGIGFGTTELHVLRPRGGIIAGYLYYITRAGFLREKGIAFMSGTAGQKRVPEEFLAELLIPMPSIKEQEEVVYYLDRETAKVDALVAKKERLVELLEERRAALISRAVTRGLDADAPLKPSGVPWLGDIPGGWEVLPLKRIAYIRYGLGQPPAEAGDGVPVIRATNVKSGRIIKEGLIYVDPDDIPPGRDAFLRTNEIIVVRSGALTGDSAIITEEYNGAVAGYDMVVRVNEGEPEFVAWQCLAGHITVLQFNYDKLRAAQPHLNAEELGNTLFVVPPKEEQRAIVAFLDRETAKIDALVAKVREGIEKLTEYRTALISAAVTGKIDVRGEAGEAAS